MIHNHNHIEDEMSQDELEYLHSKYNKQSQIFYKGVSALLIVAVLIPLAYSIIQLFLNYPKQSIGEAIILFFYYLFFILLLVSAIIYFVYTQKLKGLIKDLKSKTKTIETANIIDKKYMDINHSYHVYTTSMIKYSIEVSDQEFNTFNINDEINIEFATFSKEYFGYY